MDSGRVYEAPHRATRCTVNGERFNSVVFLKSFIAPYCGSGRALDVVHSQVLHLSSFVLLKSSFYYPGSSGGS